MRELLIWSPNYAPELTGIPPLVTDAAEWLARRHPVEVVTAMPNYPSRRIDSAYRGRVWCTELRNGVDVHRSWLRVRPQERFRDKAIYEASFSTLSLPLVIRRIHRADTLLCVVPTLLSAAYAATLRRLSGRMRLVLWVQDLVLGAALSVDRLGFAAHSALGIAARAERFSARTADAIVTCSPGFARYFSERGVDEQRIVVIPNWVDVDRIRPTNGGRVSGPVRFLYSGNLGYTQGFETLFAAAAALGDDAEVVVVGDGNSAASVRVQASSLPNVSVQRLVPEAEFPALLATADVQVVLQRQISASVNLPSKIGSYLASGRPIVASIGLDTPAAEMLRASGAAVLVRPDDADALAAAMRRLADSPELRADLGRSGRAYAVANLAREQLLERLEAVIVG